jgi:hypothetical protein
VNSIRILVPFILIAETMAGCAGTPAVDSHGMPLVNVETGMVPNGPLGVPLGQLVELAGTRIDGPKSGTGSLNVQAIDGRPVVSPTSVWIEGVDLPKNIRCVIRGYETIETHGEPPAYEQLARLHGWSAPSQVQAGWEIYCKFVPLEAVEPKTLHIGKTNRSLME